MSGLDGGGVLGCGVVWYVCVLQAGLCGKMASWVYLGQGRTCDFDQGALTNLPDIAGVTEVSAGHSVKFGVWTAKREHGR